ncbi:hypothetical protein EDD28_2973 [Salana multivorans]|uniref:Uncharacterized protein n=1 Tax=Salana multivorans TaxID=120377 RepID=A0A3N2D1A4_9MICO|nr:hypothetical protein [Salana multivorans]MBN8883602.1 hypothetical protein [Salana multivorans]OJX94333.1 MAG: hypothetical protein BGO96_15645 [Micrococcales bacterium 73-15]ROR93555.1 hypothetical protein EDD28_2973 [Salana multivorans]
MPWWLVWVLLSVAALVFLGWVLLRLWRAFRALLAELEALGELMDRLEARMAELDELAAAEGTSEGPGIVLTPRERAELHALRAEIKARRNARRQARYRKVSATWDGITG